MDRTYRTGTFRTRTSRTLGILAPTNQITYMHANVGVNNNDATILLLH